MNNVCLDTFTSFPFDVRGRILVMDHCASYLHVFSHGFGLFTNLLLSYFNLYLLLSLKMLLALWPSLKNKLFVIWCWTSR